MKTNLLSLQMSTIMLFKQYGNIGERYFIGPIMVYILRISHIFL